MEATAARDIADAMEICDEAELSLGEAHDIMSTTGESELAQALMQVALSPETATSLLVAVDVYNLMQTIQTPVAESSSSTSTTATSTSTTPAITTPAIASPALSTLASHTLSTTTTTEADVDEADNGGEGTDEGGNETDVADEAMDTDDNGSGAAVAAAATSASAAAGTRDSAHDGGGAAGAAMATSASTADEAMDTDTDRGGAAGAAAAESATNASTAARGDAGAYGGGGEGDEKKQRFVWSDELHQRFCKVVHALGIDLAKPKRIREVLAQLDPHAPRLPTLLHIRSHLQKYRLKLKESDEASVLAPAPAATDALDDAIATALATTATVSKKATVTFNVGDLVRCRVSPSSVCRPHSIFKVICDGKTPGDGCRDGQVAIQLVKPHNKCIIDPLHLMTAMVNGIDLEGPLPPDTVISNYTEIGSYKEFFRSVTQTQLDDMLRTMLNTEGMLPLFPELPSPFQLFRVPMGLGLQQSAEFLYHVRGAQNWAHHHLHYVLLTFWLWGRSPDGRITTGVLADPILIVKNGVTGIYRTTSDHRTIPLPALALSKRCKAYIGPTYIALSDSDCPCSCPFLISCHVCVRASADARCKRLFPFLHS
jgi:SHAQKYF class myb-like DNA-binding protein